MNNVAGNAADQPKGYVPLQQNVNINLNTANVNLPVKSKTAAGILAILLGDIGIHYFYLGKVGMGILFLLFSWTGIPAIVGLIQGIIMLTQSKESFEQKWRVRCSD